MLAVQSMAEELFLRVKIIKDDVCIGGAAGREDDDLGNGCQIPDELCAMRTNADACRYGGAAFHWKIELYSVVVGLLIAVNEGLIQIEVHGL